MRKIISVVLSFGLLFQQSGLLYAAGEINLANYLSQARSAIFQPDVFQPARLRYISYDAAGNDFKILLDKGNNVNQKTEKPKNEKTLEFLNSQAPELNESTQELFRYFLIGLALPNDTFWVNLRPDAPENIIDPLLEKTDIGKIFLEADLQLKKDTSSLTSPQNPEGKSYWDKLYKKAGELFGTENITIPTITRPWIVPNEVIVRETEDSAYIYKATLKVMLEEDYLRGMKDDPAGASRRGTINYSFNDPRLKELNEYSTQLIRETIIPKLTKEINSSKRYAKLRQVYYSLVLSRWFKQKYSSLGSARALERQSAGASANNYLSLIDSGNLANLTTQEPCDKQAYFQAYQKSFKDGEYNLKETVATPFGQSIRSYISGGLGMGFEYKAVNSPVVGLKVNSSPSPVTETLIGQPPATTASPLTIEQSKELFKEIVKIIQEGEPVDRYKKIPNMQDRKYDTFSSLKKLCEEFISHFEAESGLDSLKKGELWRLKKFSLSLNVSIIAEKFPEKFYQSIATKMALLNPTDKLTGIEYDPNGRPSHVRFRDAIKIDIKDGKGNVRPFYCDIKVFPDNKIENKYEVMLIQGSDRVSIIVSEHGIKPAPINTNLFYNFHSDEELIPVAQSIVSFFNYSRAAGSPLTPKEIKNKAIEALEDADPYFGYYRRNYYYGLDYGFAPEKWINAADDNSRNDIVQRLEAEISHLNVVIKKEQKGDDGVVYGEAIRLKNIFKVLVKQLKNDGKKESASPLTAEQEKLINKITIATSGREFKSVPEEILYRIESIIGRIAGVKVKIEAGDMAKPINDLNGLKEFDSLDWAGFIILLEKYFGVELIEDSKIKNGNEIVEDLRGRMSKENGGEFEGLLRLICRVGIDDLLKKVPRSMPMAVINEIKESINEDEIGDAASKLGIVFLYKEGYKNLDQKAYKSADACTLIRNAWLSVTAGSPLTGQAKVVSSSLKKQVGGIDLTDRMLNMRIERVGSFALSALVLPEINNLEALDLDKEYERIQAMVSSSIRPSDTRILEFAAACYYRGEFDQRLSQVSSCIKAAHLADEISGRDSSAALRLATMLPDALYGG